MNPIPKGRKWTMRFITVIFNLERVFYKAFYFYLFPYLVVVISYLTYPEVVKA